MLKWRREPLEEHTRKVHRLYLAALMRIEVLEGEGRLAAEGSEHELQSRLMRMLLEQLGYVPRGLTSRSEIERDIAAGLAVMAGLAPRLGRSARAATRAGTSIRLA